MKRSIVMSLVIGTAVIFFGCSENNSTAPDISQTGQAPHSLAKPTPLLTCTIEYWFVGHLGIFDAEGRILVWETDVHGDIEGHGFWWFVPGGGPPNMPSAAHVSFYEARWEIYDGDVLLLAGNDAGTTATPPGKDGIWRGSGIVTEASPEFEDWIGRHMYAAGNVNWDFPFSGEGIFRIN